MKLTDEEIIEKIKNGEIKDRKTISDNYRDFFRRFRKNKPELLNSWFPLKNISRYEEIVSSKESIQKFIDDNNLVNSSDVQNKFPGLHRKIMLSPYKNEITYKSPRHIYSKPTGEELLKFIEKNDIQNRYYFQKKFPKFYYHCKYDWGLDDYMVFRNKTTYNRWESFKNCSDFQKFIHENNIIGKKDFNTRFRGLYQKASNLKILDKLIYEKSIFSSLWEEKFFNHILNKLSKFLSKKDITLHKSFGKDKCLLTIDFYFEINSIKFGIEINGPYHFLKLNIRKFISGRKHDILKHRKAVKENINLYYFSFSNELVEKFGYPYYTYTNIEELFNDIINKIK